MAEGKIIRDANYYVSRQVRNYLGNLTSIETLNDLPCGLYDRYISGVPGFSNGWYGILVATADNDDGVPTQILFGTNRIYVRHSDDRSTWVTKSCALS